MLDLRQRSKAMRPAWEIAVLRSLLAPGLAIVLAIALQVFVRPMMGEFYAKLLLDIGTNIMLAVSLTMVNGFTGQFSLGHAAFMAIGGYLCASLVYYGSARMSTTDDFADANVQSGMLSTMVAARDKDIGEGKIVSDDSTSTLFVGGDAVTLKPGRLYRLRDGDDSDQKKAPLAVITAGPGTYEAGAAIQTNMYWGMGNRECRIVMAPRAVTRGDGLFFISLLAGGLGAAACGYIVGLPSLRLRGDYLAIVTLGFGEIVRDLISIKTKNVISVGDTITEDNLRQISTWAATKQVEGIPFDRILNSNLAPEEINTLLKTIESSSAADHLTPDHVQSLVETLSPVSAADVATIPTYLWPKYAGGSLGFSGLPSYSSLFWVWMFAIFTLIVAYRLKISSYGRAFLSIREDEIAAESMGVNTTRYKVQAFVISAFFAGVAGGLFAHTSGVQLNAGELGFQKSFDIIILVVLGGLGSISGATIAAILLTMLPELLRQPPSVWPWGVVGAVVVASIMAMFSRKKLQPFLVIGGLCLGWELMRFGAAHYGVKLSDYRMVLYALVLILMMILRPQGLMGLGEIWELRIGGGKGKGVKAPGNKA